MEAFENQSTRRLVTTKATGSHAVLDHALELEGCDFNANGSSAWDVPRLGRPPCEGPLQMLEEEQE